MCRVPRVACNIQHVVSAACNVEYVVCEVPKAECIIQHVMSAECNMQLVVCRVPKSACSFLKQSEDDQQDRGGGEGEGGWPREVGQHASDPQERIMSRVGRHFLFFPEISNSTSGSRFSYV